MAPQHIISSRLLLHARGIFSPSQISKWYHLLMIYVWNVKHFHNHPHHEPPRLKITSLWKVEVLNNPDIPLLTINHYRCIQDVLLKVIGQISQEVQKGSLSYHEIMVRIRLFLCKRGRTSMSISTFF